MKRFQRRKREIQMNLTKCPNCGAPLIAEELKTHRCFGDVRSIMWSEFDGFTVSDGHTWYQWFPPTKVGQPKKTTRDGTKPEIRLCPTNG